MAQYGDTPLPFGPGWIGCFGYGLRAAFEDVPERHADDTGIADVELAYYPAVDMLGLYSQIRQDVPINHRLIDKLADALFRAGKHHELLVLSDFTHMVADPLVTMRLNKRIVEFFQTHLVR